MNVPIQTHLNSFCGSVWQIILLTVNMRCQLRKVCATWLLQPSLKMSTTKNGEKRPSVPPSSPLCRPRYLTDFAHIIVIVNFLGSCSNLKLYECTLSSVRTAFITNLQSTTFKDRIDILLSHYPQWEHELLIMASLFPISRIVWNFEMYEYTSIDVYVWIRYCPTAHNFSCILLIVITAIGLN